MARNVSALTQVNVALRFLSGVPSRCGGGTRMAFVEDHCGSAKSDKEFNAQGAFPASKITLSLVVVLFGTTRD